MEKVANPVIKIVLTCVLLLLVFIAENFVVHLIADMMQNLRDALKIYESRNSGLLGRLWFFQLFST